MSHARQFIKQPPAHVRAQQCQAETVNGVRCEMRGKEYGERMLCWVHTMVAKFGPARLRIWKND